MFEQKGNEKICPTCGAAFFPECGVFRRYFCGDEEVCQPPDKKDDIPDCRVYEFCTEKCLEEYSDKTPECEYVPKWKRLMGRISDASNETGITGVRQHELLNKKRSGLKVKSNG